MVSVTSYKRSKLGFESPALVVLFFLRFLNEKKESGPDGWKKIIIPSPPNPHEEKNLTH